MNYYRLSYSQNIITACTEAIDIANDLPYYEHNDGQLMFALVKAKDELEAKQIGSSIAEEITKSFKPAEPA